ncbi:TPA: ornithine carbamoyltransferase [Enterobacter hormaechei subsp. steigerwaltii]|nr:ornithine carbamoyltransferase [Enterobacter hormaechei subsp. steigerwaltii]
MMDHNKIVAICQDAIDSPFKQGSNDCNIIALRVVDVLTGSDWESKCKYKTLKGGLKQLKDLGVEYTIDLILSVLEEVTVPIDGDLWVDPANKHNICIVISGRLLGVTDDHANFALVPKRKDGTYYRIRK